MIRARRWAALLAITGLLLLPVTMWAHGQAMGITPCATGAMPGSADHHAPPAPDRPADDACCTLCLLCTPLVALPAIPPPVGVEGELREVPSSEPEPATHHPAPAAHLLPFAVGPPPLLA